MLKKTLLLFTLTLSLFIPVLAQSNQSNSQEPEDSVIKVDTEIVSFDVQVLNKKTNSPVNGLTEKDFEVYEDNVKQVISNFSQDKVPLSVLLLLDVSGSVDPILPQIKNGAIHALQLLKSEDEVGVMAFASGTAALNTFSKDKTLIINNIEEAKRLAINFGKATFLNEALYDASIHMKKYCNPNYRKVVIVITDDITNEPYEGHTRKETINKLLEAGITVCGIIVNNSHVQASNQSSPTLDIPTFTNNSFLQPLSFQGRGGNKPPTPPPPTKPSRSTPPPVLSKTHTSNNFRTRLGEHVEAYAKETGGEVIDVRKQSISEKFIELVEHLRARYSIGYAPSSTKKDGKLKNLKVNIISTGQNFQLKKDDLTVRTKKGYFAPKETN